MNSYIAAAVQWKPEINDARRGVDKAIAAIEEAAAGDARLVVFPEAWLQGYPYWASRPPADPEYQYFRQGLWNSAISSSGPEITRIAEAAKSASCNVALGYHERAAGSIFASQIFIGSDGGVLGHHRKLMPTMVERTVWGMGDGSDLDAYDTQCGRLGGLMCFEHQMAPARHACCYLGIEVHIGQWPGHAFLDGIVDASMRHLAHENACFVVVAREIMDSDQLPESAPLGDGSAETYSTHGGSSIISPGGDYLVPPVFGEETIVFGEIDLAHVGLAKWWVDGTGHYSRPDIFQMHWDRSKKSAVSTGD